MTSYQGTSHCSILLQPFPTLHLPDGPPTPGGLLNPHENLLWNHQNQKGQSDMKIKGEGNFLPKFRKLGFQILQIPKIPAISIIQVTGSTSCQWLQLSYRGKNWMAVTWTIANDESESPARWYTAIQPLCCIYYTTVHFWPTIEYPRVFDAAQLGGPKPSHLCLKWCNICLGFVKQGFESHQMTNWIFWWYTTAPFFANKSTERFWHSCDRKISWDLTGYLLCDLWDSPVPG